MHRIKRVSKVVKLVAHALSVVSLLAAILTAYGGLTSLSDSTAFLVTSLHGAVLCLLLMAVLHKLAKLAERYEHGELFEASNVGHLRAIGWLVLLMAVRTGFEYDAGLDDYSLIVEPHVGPMVAGFLFIFMSWVMSEAHTLDEEHGLTV